MKWAVRIGLGLGVLLVAAAAALAVVLPRFANDEAVKSRIEDAARRMVGRELRYERIDFAFLPPSLHVEAPTLSGESPEDPDFASASRLDLRVGLWPLLRGQFEVASFIVEELAVHLVRNEDGLVLPTPVARERETEPGSPDDAPGPEGPPPSESEPGIMLGIGRIAIREGRIELEDRTLEPPVTTQLENLDVTARGGAIGDPIDIEGSFDVGGGGVRIDGSATTTGPLDLRLVLEALPLDALVPYAGLEGEWGGKLDGAIDLGGTTDDPSAASEGLRFRGAKVRNGPLALDGDVDVEFGLANARSALAGPFRLDLSDADVRYGNDFTKAPQVPAVVSGRLEPGSQGATGIEDLRLVLRNLEATGRLETGAVTTLELAAAAFETEGWDEIIPPLGLAPLSGRLAIPGLAVTTGPTRLHGKLTLDGLAVAVPDLAPIQLNGDVAFQGEDLETRGLVATVAEQTIPLTLAIQDLFEKRDLRLDLETKAADSNALLTALAEQPDRLHGPLDAKGSLRARLSGDGAFTNTLNGNLDFQILKGKIVGGSLLEAVLGPLGSRLAELGRGQGGRDLQRFYGEEFERLSGTLRIAKGEIITEPVELVHRDYGADLTGPIALDDLSLDMRGAFTFYETLDAELAKAFGARKGYTPRQRTVELASIRGQMGSPKVRLAANSVTQLAAAYATDAQRGELRRKVDKELGEGTGEIVDRVLDGILGGR